MEQFKYLVRLPTLCLKLKTMIDLYNLFLLIEIQVKYEQVKSSKFYLYFHANLQMTHFVF